MQNSEKSRPIHEKAKVPQSCVSNVHIIYMISYHCFHFRLTKIKIDNMPTQCIHVNPSSNNQIVSYLQMRCLMFMILS